MYTWKVYQLIASSIDAWNRSRENENFDWEYKHHDAITKLVNTYLPHGSGINYDYDIDAIIINSNHDKLTFFNHYDTMENGMYDRIIDFKVIVKPSLINTLDINVIGSFGKDQDIKNYLIDCYYTALTQDITQGERMLLNG